jgi:ADP-heptose:LPS heptosyltransferase
MFDNKSFQSKGRIFVKNILTLITFFPLKLYLKPKPNNQNNYIFINTGQIGDLILSSQVLNNSNLFPKKSNIYFIVKKEYVQIYKSYFGRVQIIEWDALKYRYSIFHRIRFLKLLQSLNCKYAINITCGRGAMSDELTLLSGANITVCFKINQKHLIKYFRNYYDKYYTYVKEFNTNNEFEKISKMIYWLTGELSNDQLSYYLSGRDSFYGQEILKEIKTNELDRIIIINPFTDLAVKDWPKENYKSLILLLSKNLNFKILLQGTKKQERAIKKLISKKSENVFNIAGKFSLHESSVLLSQSNLFIGNDSGFSHIAIALGINMIGIVGCGSYGMFSPYPTKSNAFLKYKDVDCKGCEWRCIKPTRACLEEVSPREIYQLSVEILNAKP